MLIIKINMYIIKILLKFWLEILLAIIILYWADNLQFFLLYGFVVILFTIWRLTNYLRKMVRIYQVFNEVKVLSIIRKLKITDDEISIVMEGEKNKMGKDKWDEIEKEFKELLQNN